MIFLTITGISCLFIYAGLIQYALYTNNKALAQINNTTSVVIEKLNQSKEFAINLGNYMNDAIMGMDGFFIEGYHSLRIIRDHMDEIVEINYDPEGRIKELAGTLEDYQKIADDLSKRIEANNHSIDADAMEDDFYDMEDLLFEFTDLLQITIEKQHSGLTTNINELQAQNAIAINRSFQTGIVMAAFVISLFLFFAFGIKRSIGSAIEASNIVAQGDLDTKIPIRYEDEGGYLTLKIEQMRSKLKEKIDQEHWRQQKQHSISKINDAMRGDQSLEQLCANILSVLVPTLNATTGIAYGAHDNNQLIGKATYSIALEKGKNDKIEIGESISGKCAKSRNIFLITDPPENYSSLKFSFGTGNPKNILAIPFIFGNNLVGVFEISSMKDFTDQHIELVSSLSENIGTAIHTANSKHKTQKLSLVN